MEKVRVQCPHWVMSCFGAASGQRGRTSDQLGTAFGQRHMSANEAESEDLDDEVKSHAGSLANSADGSCDLPRIMPDKPPTCFLCSEKANSIFPHDDQGVRSYRPWDHYNKVYQNGRAVAKRFTGCNCMPCRNVYKAGGFIARYGSLQAYRKVLAKKDGNLIHAEFLACLKEWMKQHDENPEQTKLKVKNRATPTATQTPTATPYSTVVKCFDSLRLWSLSAPSSVLGP